MNEECTGRNCYLGHYRNGGGLEEGSWSRAAEEQPQLYLGHTQDGEETATRTGLNLEEHSGDTSVVFGDESGGVNSRPGFYHLE